VINRLIEGRVIRAVHQAFTFARCRAPPIPWLGNDTMRWSTGLAIVIVVTATACDVSSGSPQTGVPTTVREAVATPIAADEPAALPAHLAVRSAVDAARQATAGRWELTAAAEFLDGQVRQAYSASRAFDRSVERAAIEVHFEVSGGAGGRATQVPDNFQGLVTEAVRDRDRVFVRLGGERTSDPSWYELGDVALSELVAWSLLAVDPLGDRIPLLGLADAGGVEVGAGIAGTDGGAAYPIRLPGDEVVVQLHEDAPALAAFLPDEPSPDLVATIVPGTVVLDPSGALVSVELDLDSLFMGLAAVATDPHDRGFFQTADLTLRIVVGLGPVEIAIPPESQVVPPAPIIEDSPSDALVVGDCLPPGTDLTADVLPLVSCDDAHVLEVFLVGSGGLPGDAYPGREQVRAMADALCTAAFEGYVGLPFDESIHALATVTPLPEGWASGDRAVICLAESYLPRRGTLAGSQA
jgi:Septum formation